MPDLEQEQEEWWTVFQDAVMHLYNVDEQTYNDNELEIDHFLTWCLKKKNNEDSTGEIMPEDAKKAIWAYVMQGMSMRQVDEKVFGVKSPLRGGGFITQRVLKKYGITGETQKEFQAIMKVQFKAFISRYVPKEILD